MLLRTGLELLLVKVSHDVFTTVLKDLVSKSHSSKMWVGIFIKPVIKMMLYVKAE